MLMTAGLDSVAALSHRAGCLVITSIRSQQFLRHLRANARSCAAIQI